MSESTRGKNYKTAKIILDLLIRAQNYYVLIIIQNFQVNNRLIPNVIYGCPIRDHKKALWFLKKSNTSGLRAELPNNPPNLLRLHTAGYGLIGGRLAVKV